MNITFYQGNKPCKETKKKRSVGGWEKGGEREEVPCGRYCDSRKGVQTHFADLVNNPCRVDWRSSCKKRLRARSRVSLPPEAGSRLPPLLAASPLRYLRATGNLRGPAPRGQSWSRGTEPPSRLLPAPLPSSLLLLLHFFPLVTALEKKNRWPQRLYCKVPKVKVKLLKGQHLHPALPGPGRGIGSQTPPNPRPKSPVLFSSTGPGLGSAPRPARPDGGCCCRANTHALCNFPALCKGLATADSKTNKCKNIKQPKEKRVSLLCPGDFSPEPLREDPLRLPCSARAT